MAKLIVQCHNCKTDVEAPEDFDLSMPGADKLVGEILKVGTLCEVCAAEYSQFNDDSYIKIKPSDLAGNFDIPKFIMDEERYPVAPWLWKELAKQFKKMLDAPLNIELLNCKPGAILKVRRYKPEGK